MPTLNWIGKDKVINHHLDVPYRILEKQYTYNAEASENKIIHGDNLEALKSLLPEYEGRIKCIYIDPPYNTGNEGWVYNDNVNDPKIKKWLGEVVGKESEDLTRHDKWLCMMYPRLKLLHRLLADDGAIFISINYHNEHANLRLILDEIFGSNNHIGDLTWESTTQPTNSGNARFQLQQKIEPIILFAKNKNNMRGFNLEEVNSGLEYPHDGKLGKCRFAIIEKSDAGGYSRPTMKFKILGQYPREGKRWQIGKDTAEDLEKRNRLEIVDGIVKMAIYPEDEIDKRKFIPFWSHFEAKEVGTAQTGKDLLNTIMNYAVGFDTIKPTLLIEKLLSYITSHDSIILDSFAGSGTTAHAVLNLNKQDGGNRKFILVEMEDYADNITAERVKRVIDGYGEGKSVEGTGGDFSYYELGSPMFIENDYLNEELPLQEIHRYIWYTETAHPFDESTKEHPHLLGVNDNSSYYFFYDKDSLTTLNHEFLQTIKQKSDTYVIYADNCVLPKEFMAKNNIIFKKIPRDITRF